MRGGDHHRHVVNDLADSGKFESRQRRDGYLIPESARRAINDVKDTDPQSEYDKESRPP